MATNKRRGLGRSLQTLLAVTETDAASPQDNLSNATKSQDVQHSLPIGQLKPGKYQPRRAMDDSALQELAQSIASHGIIQPIIVRNIKAGQFEIIAGERRWRAAQLAGLTDVPVVIRELDDEATLAISLIENIQREDLNPVEEARAMQRLIDEFDLTHQQVAQAVGRSRAAVSNMLRLLNLESPLLVMLEHGDLEMGHARALAVLEAGLQVKAAEEVIAKNLSVRETESLVKRWLEPKTTPVRNIIPELKALEDRFAKCFGSKTKVQCNAKGKGKVTISYNSIKELESILAKVDKP